MPARAIFVLLALLPAQAVAYQHFQKRIPNGDRVPNPFRANHIWSGVGHAHENGGGTQNPFGRDFAWNNFVSITHIKVNFIYVFAYLVKVEVLQSNHLSIHSCSFHKPWQNNNNAQEKLCL